MIRRVLVRAEQAALLRKLDAEAKHAIARFELAAEAVLAGPDLWDGSVLGIDGDAIIVEVPDAAA